MSEKDPGPDPKHTEASDAGLTGATSDTPSSGQNNGTQNNASAVYCGRPSTDRPIYKLSVKLIDTYKYINKVYYEEKAKKAKTESSSGAGSSSTSGRGGTYNEGYDDQHYDYILHNEEVFADRYILRQRIGKGSFGQVVAAYDQVEMKEVAIKIIKSRRPFTLQAQTEIELLQDILDKDPDDEHNIVRMIHKFVYRNHQCLVFEMLSYNLYELLKNTRFKGVSLNLIRKFSKSILKALAFLSLPTVNIIHCDLKPENILLKHPRRSAIKLIDFGSSCYESKRTYTYIQSRFYRSPEILLGHKYNQQIDIWSLGCVLVEMHTGEPLFGGADQVDQMCRIVDVLGMPPFDMIDKSPESNKSLFFIKMSMEEYKASTELPPECDNNCRQVSPDGTQIYLLKRPPRDSPPARTLSQIIGVDSGGPFGRRRDEVGHSQSNYIEFLNFISGLLHYDPSQRRTAALAINDPYILDAVNNALTGATNNVTNEQTMQIGTPTSENVDSSSGDKRRGRHGEQADQKSNRRSLSAPAAHQQQQQQQPGAAIGPNLTADSFAAQAKGEGTMSSPSWSTSTVGDAGGSTMDVACSPKSDIPLALSSSAGAKDVSQVHSDIKGEKKQP